MNIQQLYKDYLNDIKLMQLATCTDNNPWLCNVWFVRDKEDNIYWTSRKMRRHSQEIQQNPRVACTFHKWFDEGLGQKGQALVMSGPAEIVTGDALELPYDLYTKRYPKFLDVQTLEETKNATKDEEHYFYKMQPDEIVWFDEINFPQSPRQQVK